jgi:hypothetical protein
MAEALGYGIIVNFKDSMPIFIHQSYAEYFVASFWKKISGRIFRKNKTIRNTRYNI